MAETTTAIVRRVEEKLDALAVQVAEMRGSLLARVDQHELNIADHEKRLRSLERFRYAIPSAAALSAVAALGTLVYVAFH